VAKQRSEFHKEFFKIVTGNLEQLDVLRTRVEEDIRIHPDSDAEEHSRERVLALIDTINQGVLFVMKSAMDAGEDARTVEIIQDELEKAGMGGIGVVQVKPPARRIKP
jgi:hypothetical protein